MRTISLALGIYMMFLLGVFLGLAEAAPAPGCPIKKSLLDSLKPIVKAGVIDEADRRTAADYGAENGKVSEKVIESRYAATGDFRCGKFVGQAQVTVKNDVITTAAHTIYNEMTCRNPSSISKCKFTVTIDGKKQSYPLKDVIESGFKCPTSASITGATDWMVIKLAKPVDSRIKPYKVRASDLDKSMRYADVVAVGKDREFNPKKVGGPFENLPRHYGNCKIKRLDDFNSPRTVDTDCDLSPGDSGGSLLSRGDDPSLLGINVAVSKQQDDCPQEPYRKNRGEFNSRCWSSSTVLVNGRLRDVLLGLNENDSESNPGKQDAPLGIDL